MTLRSCAVVLAAVLSASAASGCQEAAICNGMLTASGECRPVDVVVTPASCGTGTKLENGQCVAAIPPMVCDPQFTFVDIDPDTGVQICRSECVVDWFSCDSSVFPCPQATAGNSTICGRLFDAFSNAQIEVDGFSRGHCNPNAPTLLGPCALRMRLYDFDELASDPAGAAALSLDELTLTECGDFRAVNVQRPNSGRIAIVVEDVNVTPTQVRSATVVTTQSAETRNNVPLFIVSKTANNAWSQATGLSDPDLSSRGAVLSIFKSGGVPVSGVRVSRGGSTATDDDFYFSDTSSGYRTTIDPLADVTGINGAALLVNSPVTDLSGDGPGGADCEWSSEVVGSVPGFFFTQPITHLGSGACP